jgi:fatty acid desaturase (delta-4 desaturase)
MLIHQAFYRYKFDTEFEREIKKEVFKIVRRGKEFGTYGWFFRAMCYCSAFCYLQYLFSFQGATISMALLFGVSQALIGMNVQHDANHGACSKKPWVNDFGRFCRLDRWQQWLWMEQHWTRQQLHQPCREGSRLVWRRTMLLFNDCPLDHPARMWYHRFQVFFTFRPRWLLGVIRL